MSKFEYLETAIWIDPVFEDCRPFSKLIYLWSFTNPACSLTGIYKVSRRAIHNQTGVPTKGVEAALKELEAARLLWHDGTWIFVRARVKYLHNTSPNTAKGVAKELKKLNPEHPYTQAFLFLYSAEPWLLVQLEGFDLPSTNPLMGVAA